MLNGAKMLFVLATAVKSFSQTYISGSIGILILFLRYMVTRFAPTMIMVWYLHFHYEDQRAYDSYEPYAQSIGCVDLYSCYDTFFPTIGEEYRSIRDAMKMRGYNS